MLSRKYAKQIIAETITSDRTTFQVVLKTSLNEGMGAGRPLQGGTNKKA